MVSLNLITSTMSLVLTVPPLVNQTPKHITLIFICFMNMGVLSVYLMCAVPVEAMGLDSLQLELQTVVSPMRVVGPEHWSSVRTASGLSH